MFFMTVTNYKLILAPYDGFPWFRRFASKGELVQIEYKSNIENKHLVFRAEAIQENGNRHPIVVKFTPTYGTAAHIFCEKVGCAPTLFHESQVRCSISRFLEFCCI